MLPHIRSGGLIDKGSDEGRGTLLSQYNHDQNSFVYNLNLLLETRYYSIDRAMINLTKEERRGYGTVTVRSISSFLSSYYFLSYQESTRLSPVSVSAHDPDPWLMVVYTSRGGETVPDDSDSVTPSSISRELSKKLILRSDSSTAARRKHDGSNPPVDLRSLR
jgi:hypothetical protein